VAAVITKIKLDKGCDSSWSLTWLRTALTTCQSQVDSIEASHLLGSDYIHGNNGYTNETSRFLLSYWPCWENTELRVI